MKRILLALFLFTLATLVVACDAQPSEQPTQQPQGSAPSATTPSQPNNPASVPQSVCRSRVWGKVTNATTGQAPANVTVEIAGGALNGKTITDANGLYGYDGLCAGDYTLTITPPNGKPQPGPKVTTDGTKQVKVDMSFK
jgi:hypothetical protein